MLFQQHTCTHQRVFTGVREYHCIQYVKKSCIKPLASPERAVRSHQVMSLESESVGCKPVGVELNRSLLQAPCLRLRLAAPGYIRH